MKSRILPYKVVLAILCCPFADPLLAADVQYNFANENRTPAITGDTGGVTLSNFAVNALDTSGGTNGVIHIKGGLGTDTRAALDANRVLSFTVTIPAGTVVTFKSMSMAFGVTGYASNGVTNARVFTDIQGDDNLTGDTVGIVGKQASEPVDQTSDTLNLEDATTNPGKGGSITAADFQNLTERSVTFRMPWLSNSNATTAYIEISQVTFSFDVVSAPPPTTPLMVTDFHLAQDHSAEITFTGPEDGPYALMASSDLVGPLYRKRWELVTSGAFGAEPVAFSDPAAVGKPRRFYSVAQTDLPRARIMPVGDSITEGGGAYVVYKGPLYDKLTQAGYRFEYVGSKTSSYDSPLYGTVSLKHEGFSGNNATQVASQLASHFPSYPADIVLIHAGHNMNVDEDVLDGPAEAAIVATVETATRSMITTCRNGNPKVRILLAQVIPSGKLPKYSYIPALNVRLGQIAAELNTTAQPVIAVNQADGFIWETDTITADKVHPNADGAEKMAVKWFDALAPLLE